MHCRMVREDQKEGGHNRELEVQAGGRQPSLEFDEPALDGGSKDSSHSEQKEMVITGSSVSSLSASRWRISIHGIDSGGHSLKSVIRKEL